MTCNYSNRQWRDALYNAVRATHGGIAGAAAFLAQRRDVAMHAESLRRKLRGGDHLDVDIACLLAEYVRTDARACAKANDWLLSLCAQEGLLVDDAPAGEGASLCSDAQALTTKFLELSAVAGSIAAVTTDTVADDVIDRREADTLIPLLRAIRAISHRMERRVRRATGEGGES